MADKELVEGLRTALSRGESLEQAMYTFFNAGYEKAKIEEAAKALVYQRQPESMPQRPVFPKPKPRKILKPSPMPLLPKRIEPQLKPQPSLPVSKPMPQPKPITEEKPQEPEKPSLEPYIPEKPIKETTEKPPKQIVSGYEKQKTSKKKLIVVLLIIFLIVLIGALASVFLFRQEIIEIFNNLIESF